MSKVLLKDQVAANLRWLLKMEEFFGPIPVKVNKKTNRMDLLRFRYAFWTFLCIFEVGSMIYLMSDGVDRYALANHPLYVILIRMVGLSMTICQLVQLYFCLAYKERMIRNWNAVLSLTHVLSDLSVSTSNNKTVKGRICTKFWCLMTLAPIMLNFGYMAVADAKGRDQQMTGNFVLGTSMWMLRNLCMASQSCKLVVLLLTFKCGFEQLNVLVVGSGGKRSLEKLRLVAIGHQYLCYLTRLTVGTFSVLVLASLANCIIILTVYLYQFIRIVGQKDFTLRALLEGLLPTLETVFVLALVIAPCELCMGQVPIRYEKFVTPFHLKVLFL